MHTQSVSNRTVNSILLSTQVFGAPNLSSAIFDYPIKFFFTPLKVRHAHNYVMFSQNLVQRFAGKVSILMNSYYSFYDFSFVSMRPACSAEVLCTYL